MEQKPTGVPCQDDFVPGWGSDFEVPAASGCPGPSSVGIRRLTGFTFMIAIVYHEDGNRCGFEEQFSTDCVVD